MQKEIRGFWVSLTPQSKNKAKWLCQHHRSSATGRSRLHIQLCRGTQKANGLHNGRRPNTGIAQPRPALHPMGRGGGTDYNDRQTGRGGTQRRAQPRFYTCRISGGHPRHGRIWEKPLQPGGAKHSRDQVHFPQQVGFPPSLSLPRGGEVGGLVHEFWAEQGPELMDFPAFSIMEKMTPGVKRYQSCSPAHPHPKKALVKGF